VAGGARALTQRRRPHRASVGVEFAEAHLLPRVDVWTM